MYNVPVFIILVYRSYNKNSNHSRHPERSLDSYRDVAEGSTIKYYLQYYMADSSTTFRPNGLNFAQNDIASMILPTHALVGAVIGKNIGNIWAIIPIALVSHYLLDSLRHGDYVDNRKSVAENSWKIAIDAAAAFLAIAVVIHFTSDPEKSKNILLGAFFSLLPDFLTPFCRFFPKSKIFLKVNELNAFAHRYSKTPKFSPERQWNFRNARNDIIISVIAIILLFI